MAGFEPATSCSQSRRDNRATLHPEGYLFLEKAERLGLEPRQHLRADRLAICSVTTPAPLQYYILMNLGNLHSGKLRMQMYFFNLGNATIFSFFFVPICTSLLLRIFYTKMINIGKLLFKDFLDTLYFLKGDICI